MPTETILIIKKLLETQLDVSSAIFHDLNSKGFRDYLARTEAVNNYDFANNQVNKFYHVN